MTRHTGANGRKRDGLRGLITAWAVVACLAACRAPEDGGGPDWQIIATELELGAADLRDVATVLGPGDAQDALLELADALDVAGAALGEGDGPGDWLDAVDAALVLADKLIEKLPPDAQDEARAAIIIVKAGLRRARVYAQ